MTNVEKKTILGSEKKYAGKEKNNEKESQWLTIFNVHIQVWCCCWAASAKSQQRPSNNSVAMIMASSICVACVYIYICVIFVRCDLYFQFTFQLKNDWNWKCIRSHNKQKQRDEKIQPKRNETEWENDSVRNRRKKKEASNYEQKHQQ